MKGFKSIAALLLEEKMSDIDIKDDEGDTPLHWAILLDNRPMVEFLLRNGADVSAKNTHGNNPVMIACIN